jgi:AbrB family looped-hinge helix DNA binding protein
MIKMKFYGSTTVGERGQIVLPAKLRKDFKMNKGDMLLVIGNSQGYHITLVNPDTINEHLEMITQNINQIKTEINKK